MALLLLNHLWIQILHSTSLSIPRNFTYWHSTSRLHCYLGEDCTRWKDAQQSLNTHIATNVSEAHTGYVEQPCLLWICHWLLKTSSLKWDCRVWHMSPSLKIHQTLWCKAIDILMFSLSNKFPSMNNAYTGCQVKKHSNALGKGNTCAGWRRAFWDVLAGEGENFKWKSINKEGRKLWWHRMGLCQRQKKSDRAAGASSRSWEDSCGGQRSGVGRQLAGFGTWGGSHTRPGDNFLGLWEQFCAPAMWKGEAAGYTLHGKDGVSPGAPLAEGLLDSWDAHQENAVGIQWSCTMSPPTQRFHET